MPTSKKDLAGLTLLGRRARPSKRLEVFPNHARGRRYTVTLGTNEFTCLCPATGQPDFASIDIRYIPDRWVLESKSLKLYLWSFRGEGVFHEHVINTICDDIVKVPDPHRVLTMLEDIFTDILFDLVFLEDELRPEVRARIQREGVRWKP